MGKKRKRHLVSWKTLHSECLINLVAVVQLLSRRCLFATPWTAAGQASQSLLKLMSIGSLMLSNHLILCHPFLLLLSIFPHIRVLFDSWYQVWPKYWSFSFSISPNNEYSGLISFRIDLFDLFAVQGTLRSLRQYHSSKASILRHSAFFAVQFSHPYMTTEKNHSFDHMDLCRQSDVSAF